MLIPPQLQTCLTSWLMRVWSSISVRARCLLGLSPAIRKTTCFLSTRCENICNALCWLGAFSLAFATDLKFSMWLCSGKCHTGFPFRAIAQKIHSFLFYLLQLPKCEEFKGFVLCVREEISLHIKVFFFFSNHQTWQISLLNVPLESCELEACLIWLHSFSSVSLWQPSASAASVQMFRLLQSCLFFLSSSSQPLFIHFQPSASVFTCCPLLTSPISFAICWEFR